MATHYPNSHAAFEFLSHGYTVGFSPCSYSVDLTIVDHRSAEGCWNVMIPCPNSCFSPHLYRVAMEDMAAEICYNHLHLSPCCVSLLLPQLLAKIDAVNASHSCHRTQNVELHLFPELSETTDEMLRELLEDDEILMESFEAAQPRPTPTSRASIEKLVAQKEGDDPSCSSKEGGDIRCMICLDDEIITTHRSSLKMPCSHVFHQSCIVEWLKVNHVCPLCRYEMPVDNADNSNQ